MDVTRSYYKYEDGSIERKAAGSYRAEYWNYTRDGYLLFSGIWFSEEQYALTASGSEVHTALRIQPLDETLRELNRRYLLPIGYGRNNMFIIDWSEEDFGELDFYDLYDIFYRRMEGKAHPYTMDENLGVGAVYRIPRAEFEAVIMSGLHIDSGTLRSKTVYDPADETYEYRPRGFYEVEYPEYPYPEVTGYTDNGDGTMTLTVHAVFPHRDTSSVYVHEVTVRPREDGGAEYVSNRIIPSEENGGITWHTPRLTGEEWEELYKGT